MINWIGFVLIMIGTTGLMWTGFDLWQMYSLNIYGTGLLFVAAKMIKERG